MRLYFLQNRNKDALVLCADCWSAWSIVVWFSCECLIWTRQRWKEKDLLLQRQITACPYAVECAFVHKKVVINTIFSAAVLHHKLKMSTQTTKSERENKKNRCQAFVRKRNRASLALAGDFLIGRLAQNLF